MNSYSRAAVEKAIQASRRSGRPIGAAEAKAIHRLLQGRTQPIRKPQLENQPESDGTEP